MASPKSSGRAKYSSDLKPQGMLFAELLTCPHAHARVTSIDISAAQKLKGVTSVRVMSPRRHRDPVAGHRSGGSRSDQRDGSPRRATRHQGRIRGSDPHGEGRQSRQRRQPRQSGRRAGHRRSRQGVPGSRRRHGRDVRYSGDHPLLPGAARQHGGVEGRQDRTIGPPRRPYRPSAATSPRRSKFPPPTCTSRWSTWAADSAASSRPTAGASKSARLSKESGGKPVKLFLDRATELMIAGNRPSAYAKIKVGAKKDGTIIAWQSESWATRRGRPAAACRPSRTCSPRSRITA